MSDSSHVSETILLVNDDPQVLRLLREILGRRGYAVVEAADVEEAVRILKQCAVDLLLADAMMPPAGDAKWVNRLRAFCPALRVLLMSPSPNGVSWRTLPMPFTPEALARKVREVLDAPPELPLPG